MASSTRTSAQRTPTYHDEDFKARYNFGPALLGVQGRALGTNAGTSPFLALDLLGKPGPDGMVGLYRHNAETFTWCLT